MCAADAFKSYILLDDTCAHGHNSTHKQYLAVGFNNGDGRSGSFVIYAAGAFGGFALPFFDYPFAIAVVAASGFARLVLLRQTT